ncbi:MAG TPA: metallophosphoesterase [Thermoleophilaceae bacterium]|nr:metallophosphoesterase [Thermoleophilaceae bacterium]
MRTAIVSDLHLGMAQGGDVARLPDARERLLATVGDADHVVLLGDLLELREGRLGQALASARPLLEELGRLTGGRRVTVVPGNHDHHLTEPFLSRLRLDGSPLDTENEWRVAPGDGLAGRLAEWMPSTELFLAYPGLRLRDDVYATHGHYLDVHSSVPRIESIAASAMRRLTGRRDDCSSAADHEAILAPLYAFHFALAQGATSHKALERSGRISREVWTRASAGSSPRLASLLLSRAAIPAAVALLNRAGIGPMNPHLSGVELRRSGLRAMAETVRRLRVEAGHVIHGHTHRPGPLAGDELPEWQLPGGAQLWNSGSWFYEGIFLGERPQESPYYPGTVVQLDDAGPPRLMNVLGDLDLPRLGA